MRGDDGVEEEEE
jgi:hypothetical protein